MDAGTTIFSHQGEQASSFPANHSRGIYINEQNENPVTSSGNPGNDHLNNLGSPCQRQASVLPIPGVASGFSLIKTLIKDKTKRSHKSRGEGYSSPRTRNTNEENFVHVLIPQEKPRTSGEFTRKRLAAAKYAKG